MNFALIPAAGSGQRIGQQLPKQYQKVAGRPMLCHALEAFAATAEIERVFVVIAPTDPEFAKLALSKRAQSRIEILPVGGATRQLSVENGLRALVHRVDALDWILVHDAARPGITPQLIGKLILAVHLAEQGGILALPLADTLKRSRTMAEAAYSVATVPREDLWQAQTPQMFRHEELLAALREARQQGTSVTDEASAMELAGAEPLLVAGHACNFKVTYPDDLILADQLLGLRS